MGAVFLVVVGIALWIPISQLRRVRKSDAPDARGRTIFWSVVLIGIVGYAVHFLFAPLRGLAVKIACERDGGLRLNKPVSADTYWHGQSMWNIGAIDRDCGLCVEQVSRREFAAVDFKLLANESRGRKADEWVRYQLQSLGDANCLSDRPLPGLPEGVCVAQIPLESAPKSGFRYDDNLEIVRGPLWVEMRQSTRTIIDVTTGLLIAKNRYYSARTPLEESGTFYPSHTCNDRMEKGYARKSFIDLVLRGSRAP